MRQTKSSIFTPHLRYGIFEEKQEEEEEEETIVCVYVCERVFIFKIEEAKAHGKIRN